MVDKTWDYDSNDPFTQAELLQSGVLTACTRAIFVNNINTAGATVSLWFRDNSGAINVPLQRGEIYPFGIIKYQLDGTATSAEIWGLW